MARRDLSGRLDLSTRFNRWALGVRKILHQAFSRRQEEKVVLFIMGYQRSGTSLMSEIFYRDLDARSFGEFSVLTTQDQVGKIRLNRLIDVQEVIEKQRAALIVLKPLVESHRATELLKFFPGSHVIWLYRDFRDVAKSHIRKFGLRNGIEDLRPIVNRQPGNWRSEKVSAETQNIIVTNFSEDMNPADAHILNWYARNILFFEQHLHENSNVLLCRYEDLTDSPATVVRSIYGKLGRAYPGDSVTVDIHASAVGKGNELQLTSEIEDLARQLLNRLDSVYQASHCPLVSTTYAS